MLEQLKADLKADYKAGLWWAWVCRLTGHHSYEDKWTGDTRELKCRRCPVQGMTPISRLTHSR